MIGKDQVQTKLLLYQSKYVKNYRCNHKRLTSQEKTEERKKKYLVKDV
jgi:hypothetical protein